MNLNLKRYIPIKTYNKLLNISKKSVCFIKAKNSAGTGFLIKLLIPSIKQTIYGLITNNHVIHSDFIKNNKSFSIYLNQCPEDSDSIDSIHYNISLDENYFIFTSELIDITFVQLPNIYSKNPDFIFLDPCDCNCHNNELIYVFQYPETIFSFATGFIESSVGYNYFHKASTNVGSSGAPLINKNMKVIGIHKSGLPSKNVNVATNINIVNYAINTLYNKNYINDIKKARASPKELSDDEKKELIKHGLKETSLPNMYKCLYSTSSLVMLFYRTNHGWYFTLKNKKEIKYLKNKKKIKYVLKEVKLYNWILIDLYKKFEEIINECGEKLEHQHELIILWLKISELMYI